MQKSNSTYKIQGMSKVSKHAAYNIAGLDLICQRSQKKLKMYN